MKHKIIYFNLKDAKRLLPKRTLSSNKTAGGKTVIVAGSKGLMGAAVLSATAAARAGSGYVTLLTDLRIFKTEQFPDFLTADYREQKISELKANAIAFGPGLRTGAAAKRLFLQIQKSKIPVVLDADGLNLLAMKPKRVTPMWILTPHEGELARLLKVQSSAIRKNRSHFAIEAQKKFGGVILLKGAGTLVADGKNLYQIKAGNPALAKAGTGDVLTGIIVGFLAQGLSPTQAACLGAFVHGFCADQWVKTRDKLSLIPWDLVETLPFTLKRIRSGKVTKS